MTKTTTSKAVMTIAGLAALACGAGIAAAQPVEQLERVTASDKATTSVMPYARINTLLAGIDHYGEGLFRFDFKVLPGKDHKRFATPPKLAIQHPDFYRQLPIAADGAVQLPVLTEAEAKEADILSNQLKGELQLSGTIELTTPPEELDLAGVRRVLRLSSRLKSELLPWYVRPLFPSVSGVRICSARADWEMQWRDEKGQLWGVALPLAADEKDPSAKPGEAARACTVLTGQEHWPEKARLVAPADARLSVRLL